MRCAVNRWGPGTTCERPQQTAATQELQDRLQKMKAEREQQDTMWVELETKTTTPAISKQTTSFSQTQGRKNGSEK